MQINTININGRIVSMIMMTSDGMRQFFVMEADVPGGIVCYKVRNVILDATPPLAEGDEIAIFNGQVYVPTEKDQAYSYGINVDPSAKAYLTLVPENKGDISPEEL